MEVNEKKCPTCENLAEKLVSLYRGVFVSPCLHPVIRVKSPVEQALRKILFLKRLKVLNIPPPNIKDVRKARQEARKGQGCTITEILAESK